MKRYTFWLSLGAIIFCGGCAVSGESVCGGRNFEQATLYYLPDCKEIKGYVNFHENGLQRVFQHDIPEQFRKDSIDVCIKYKTAGVGILMSDCLQSEIIEIRRIKFTK